MFLTKNLLNSFHLNSWVFDKDIEIFQALVLGFTINEEAKTRSNYQKKEKIMFFKITLWMINKYHEESFKQDS